MRVLLTGASGYVGNAIATRLCGANIEVFGVSRRPSLTTPPQLQGSFDLTVPGVSAKIARGVPPCDIIVHAAASLEKNIYDTSITLTNCLGTQEILTVASLWKSFFVYISSVPVIGMPHELPITEDHPVSPQTAYHASKLFGEHLVRLADREGAAGAILRLTSPVGPGMPQTRIFSVFVRQAMARQTIKLTGKGSRRQDYLDARDIAMAVEQCLVKRASGTYNVASGRAISNHELAQTCKSVLGSDSPIEFDGRSDPQEGWVWDVSIARARQSFGFEPRFSLEDSIRDLAVDYARCSH
jgi:nucleoside-diphosphate-sugar epimerase